MDDAVTASAGSADLLRVGDASVALGAVSAVLSIPSARVYDEGTHVQVAFPATFGDFASLNQVKQSDRAKRLNMTGECSGPR